MRIIGLTGSIGSGKTEIAAYLKKKGAFVIDADSIGHKLLQPGNQVFQKVVEVFGSKILNQNGEIDRKKLGKLVFADEGKRRLLHSIMHPPMTSIIKEEITLAKRKGIYPAIVLEAAILRESPWLSLVTEVWIVSASSETCLRRMINKKGLTPSDAKMRLKAQLKQPDIPSSITQYVIDNNQSLERTFEHVDILWNMSEC